jgi:hypothetical protein
MTADAPGLVDPGRWSPEPTPPVVVANEFAEVVVRRVSTRNGVRLEIFAPRLGRRIFLDALELEALTWQPPALFSELLEEPFGPGTPPEPWRAEPGGQEVEGV